MNSSRREFIKRIAFATRWLGTATLAKSAVFSMKENSIATLAWN